MVVASNKPKVKIEIKGKAAGARRMSTSKVALADYVPVHGIKAQGKRLMEGGVVKTIIEV